MLGHPRVWAIELWYYSAIGKVTSQWERVEFELSRLYSIFVGKPNDAMQEYGKGRIFRERACAFVESAEAYFINHPNQELEGRLHCLMCLAQGYADRRNEVAHGIVFDIQGITFFAERMEPEARSKPQFAIIPPYQTLRKHDEDGAPKYAYTSEEMLNLRAKLFNLEEKISEFRKVLLP